MYCRFCGTEYNGNFCPACGAQATPSAGPAQQNQIPVQQMGGALVATAPKVNKKRITIISIVCIVCAALLLVSLFLPYASMKRDLAKETLAEPKVKLEKNITNHDLVRLSIFEFTRINQLVLGSKNDNSYIVLFSLLAVFSGLALLFSALKKPAGIIVFDILLQLLLYSTIGILRSAI